MSLLLPHEVRWLNDALTVVRSELKTLAADKSEAQGPAFDWHDNGGLDEVNREMSKVMGRRIELDDELARAELGEYPDPDSTKIGLGSLVVANNATFGNMPFVIVGQRRVGIDEYRRAWVADFGEVPDDDPGLAVVIASNGIGQAATGASVGDTVSYRGNGGNTIRVDILSVDQRWTATHFRDVPDAKINPGDSPAVLPEKRLA